MRRQTKKLCFQFLLYLVSDVGTHSCCEGWAVSCHPPYDLCWASSMLLKSTSLTRCQPCLTLWAQEFHLDGGVCWNSLSAHRPPDVPASSSVCCSFGAQVSPHLLTSCWHIGGFYLSKDSGCVFRHMALHFRLFWQPNMIPQPILAGIKL